MKKTLVICVAVIVAALALYVGLSSLDAKWSGVDESVIERFAEQANRPPREPIINTDQGDLLLFFFLIAGAAGGFAAGYYYRELFPPTVKG